VAYRPTQHVPPGAPAQVHQHLDIGRGEVDWDLFFRTLADVGFDGIATVCVFAWDECTTPPGKSWPACGSTETYQTASSGRAPAGP
jgi:sugar phosphate isomerase/epimerase